MKDKKDNKQKRGVYFALAVCAAGIAIAGASTYTSVVDSIGDSNLSVNDASAVSSGTPHYTFTEEAAPADPYEDKLSTEEPEKVNAAMDNTETSDAEDESTDTTDTEEKEDTNSETTEETEETESPEEDTEETAAEAEEETTETAAEPTASYDISDTLKFPIQNHKITGKYDQNLKFNPIMKDYRTHNGIDIKAKVSEAVSAIANGKVISTRHDILLGNVIEIEHGEYTALYCGLGDTFLVEEGDIVAAGADIGSVYGLPMESDTDPHLHLEILKDGNHIDPAEVLEP